ncbi:MAG: 4-hydroxy-tetrahydrodipicolinate reductase [Eubacteriales bacterium]|nr:4-hydroxy-tetrahydrodipicolinate reductase [Eubacteriales bacterium]
MRIILNGALGRMGTEVDKLIKKGYKGITVAAYCDANSDIPDVYRKLTDITESADAIVDFSHHSAADELCGYALARNMSLVIATTGQTEDEKAIIATTSRAVPIFFSPNMSAGVAFLNAVVKKASSFFADSDVEIVERHHNKKLDAPSGTAKLLAETVKSITGGEIVTGRNGICPRKQGDIGVSSVRGGNVSGVHEVTFYAGNETFTVTHTAESRGMFAEGALTAAAFMKDKKPGLYTMTDLLGDL